MVIKHEMRTIEDFDWTGMWNEAIEGSCWGQRAGKPEFWDERVDWFEELVQQSDRAGIQHCKTWMNVSGDDEEKLRLYLSENLVKENGAFWLRHTLRTAMISWRKE